jgi:hypothetical protein
MTRPFNSTWNACVRGKRVVEPVVYFLKRDGEVVYIGSTVCMAERIFDHRKHGADEIEYFRTSTEEEARIAEMLLIRLFMPRKNVAIPGFGRVEDKRTVPNCTIKRLFSSRFPASKKGAVA